jgi:hypothetical protein
MFSAMIPAPVQTLLDLFTTSLADVRFADVDGPTMARHAAAVEAAADRVAAAQSALDAARGVLQESQDALLQCAQRALSYARVYADGNEGLSQELEAIALPRAARRSRLGDAPLDPEPAMAPRPRGRPRKTPAAGPTLEIPMPRAE